MEKSYQNKINIIFLLMFGLITILLGKCIMNQAYINNLVNNDRNCDERPIIIEKRMPSIEDEPRLILLNNKSEGIN
jgi:hypothetical protein